MKQGHPLRFAAVVLAGWVTMRVIVLIPDGDETAMPVLAAAPAPAVPANPPKITRVSSPAQVSRQSPASREANGGIKAQRRGAAAPVALAALVPTPSRRPISFGAGLPGPMGWRPVDFQTILQSHLSFARPTLAPGTEAKMDQAAETRRSRTAMIPADGRPLFARANARRWTGSAWMLWRADDAANGTPLVGGSPQLGGAQTGARIAWAVLPTAPLAPAVYVRGSRALGEIDATEVAAGISIRPAKGISIGVERRAAVTDGGRNAMAAYVAAGVYQDNVIAGFDVEAYAQAGIVGFGSPDGFIDGRISIHRTIAKPVDRSRLMVGASVSGGAQPGATRIDVGPHIAFGLSSLDGTRGMRLSAGWQERAAGNAIPRSGPAIILAADF